MARAARLMPSRLGSSSTFWRLTNSSGIVGGLTFDPSGEFIPPERVDEADVRVRTGGEVLVLLHVLGIGQRHGLSTTRGREAHYHQLVRGGRRVGGHQRVELTWGQPQPLVELRMHVGRAAALHPRCAHGPGGRR